MPENHKNIKSVLTRQDTRNYPKRLREDSNGAAWDKTPTKALRKAVSPNPRKKFDPLQRDKRQHLRALHKYPRKPCSSDLPGNNDLRHPQRANIFNSCEVQSLNRSG